MGLRSGRHADPAVTFLSLLRHREFAVLWLADTQSALGDQLARVALSVLVYRATGSGLATAGVYALTFLPALVGGLLLSGFADRYPRRAVLVSCDVLRTVFVLSMAAPGLPLGVVYTVLVAVVLAGTPYRAAEPALVADFFEGDRYTAASGLRTTTFQLAQLIGFGVGGAVVAAIGPRTTLLVDAGTFAVSAVALRLGIRSRAAVAAAVVRSTFGQVAVGLRVVAAKGPLRLLVGLACLAGWWVVPEGLAVPYAAAHGSGATTVGLLLAAAPAGTIVGAVVLTRWLPSRARVRSLGPLAVLSGLPLAACLADPPPVIAGLLWALTGAFSAYLVVVFPEFIARTSPDVRGQAVGLASTALLAAQGAGTLIGGLVVTVAAASTAVAVAGTAGSVCAVPLALAWWRTGPGTAARSTAAPSTAAPSTAGPWAAPATDVPADAGPPDPSVSPRSGEPRARALRARSAGAGSPERSAASPGG